MSKIERCASCHQAIVWLPTNTGKRMPINAETVLDADIYFDHTRHTSHFAPCPQADTHRRVSK